MRKGTEKLADGQLGYMLRPGGAVCVVFLHGLGCAKESFQAAFEGDWFPPELSLLAPDLPGHGASPRGPDYTYDLETQADAVLELLQRLSVRRAIFVAHSMGNICGLRLSREFQEPVGYYTLEGNLAASDCQLSMRVAKYDESTFVTKFYPIAREQFLCPGCGENGANPVALHRVASSLVAHCADDEPLGRFLELKMPKAYFFGSQNAGMPILSRLQDTEIVEVPNAGHFVMNDAPDFLWGQIARRIVAVDG